MQKINNKDKVFIKLKNGDALFGKININSDTSLSKVQIDNVNISKNNIEYIKYSPISKILKGLGIGLEIINVSLILGGILIWNSIDPNNDFSVFGYIFSIAFVVGGVALVPLGITLLQPNKVYGKKYLIKKKLTQLRMQREVEIVGFWLWPTIKKYIMPFQKGNKLGTKGSQ